jgi:hypothetical protein
MDSFTPCWKSARRSLALLLTAVCLCFLPAASAQAQVLPAEITQLRLERTDEGVLLSAQVQFELSHVVEDAVFKGIPVYFVVEAQLLRDRWYWYDKKLATATRRIRLSYHPLTRRWRVSVMQDASVGGSSGVALNQNFETLREAIASLSRLSRWKIAEASDVDTDARHNVDFSFRLDLSELPRPFQIGILGQNEWTVAVSKNQRLTVEAVR